MADDVRTWDVDQLIAATETGDRQGPQEIRRRLRRDAKLRERLQNQLDAAENQPGPFYGRARKLRHVVIALPFLRQLLEDTP